MFDYSSIKELLQSDKYVDKTMCLEQFWDFSHHTLVNCKDTGSSLFLKTFACFLDEKADSKDVFVKLAIGESAHFVKHVNSYRVLYLDFSGFDAKDFGEAKEYVWHIMSDACKLFVSHFEPRGGRLYDAKAFEHALEMIEGQPSDDVLQSSLHNLILQLRGYVWHRTDNRLAVLIDNMILMETVAEQYGYSVEMTRFLESFIVTDIYKYSDIFLQISDLEEKKSRLAV